MGNIRWCSVYLLLKKKEVYLLFRCLFHLLYPSRPLSSQHGRVYISPLTVVTYFTLPSHPLFEHDHKQW